MRWFRRGARQTTGTPPCQQCPRLAVPVFGSTSVFVSVVVYVSMSISFLCLLKTPCGVTPQPPVWDGAVSRIRFVVVGRVQRGVILRLGSCGIRLRAWFFAGSWWFFAVLGFVRCAGTSKVFTKPIRNNTKIDEHMHPWRCLGLKVNPKAIRNQPKWCP